MVQKFSELIPKQDLTTLQETFGDPAKIESEAKRIAGDISVQVDRPTAIQDAATVFDTGKVDGARDFSTRELPKPGLTQQERADQAALSAAEADLATQTPEAIAKRTGDQAEATRLALLRREKTVRTAEGEAGQKIARGVAAAEQKRAGQAGVQAQAVAGATELRQIGAKKTLDAALAADPELNKLRNRITTLNTALTKASRTEFTDSIRTALTNAQKKIDELTVDSQEAKKSDNAKLATALADADTLLAIANDPTGNAVDALQKAFPNAEFDKAAILGQAQLQKIIADFESKKALSSSEQVKLDQAKADLAKTKAQTAQIGAKGGKFELKGTAKDGFVLFNPTTGVTSPINGNSTDGFTFNDPATGRDVRIPSGIAVPEGKYNFGITPTGGLNIDVAEGQDAGQCGKFANDVIGQRVFGDDFEQKRAMVNSFTPIPGAAFIQKTDSRWGHVGIIETVNADGSLSVVESNYNNISDPEKVTRRIIKRTDPEFNAIVGYYVPPNAIQEKDVILSQIRNGQITPTQVSDVRKTAAEEGWLADLNKELNDPQNKAISTKTATAFGIDETTNNRVFDEIVQKRQELGFGNKQFQGLPTKDYGDLEKFFVLGGRLQEAKELFKEFEGQGGQLNRLFDSTFRQTGNFLAEQIIPGTSTTDEVKTLRKLQAITGEQLALFVKEISGAAVSEQEFQRLQQFKPNVGMQNSQFKDQLGRMIEEYDKSAEFKMNKWGFDGIDDLSNAVKNSGLMPTNLGEANIGDTNNIFTELGFDDSSDAIYSDIFQPIR